ncbi:electron transport complex subunit RsxB [Catenovulum adriaticum]|uniref:Ion-translocating oxidoreductase complex subunit B n=1 Tax=Catenovulum adriaticum TaxID=2984846 RepID=A0ABY7AJ24_9ALTE|nr:electron transport complex subunit RsxB [Catenovulum sp. TS8]WAJ69494.1 electron transport complex subunit RsxB [Catenovulum sp. TS8]
MILLYSLLALGLIALIFGAVLGYANIRFKVESDPLVDQIDEILPQTQCGQCGYPGCKPYAQAIADGDDINKCPPGGDSTIKKLADLTGKEVKPLAGSEENDTAEPVKKVAYIREAECIGCTKCIQACPVDAILGAAKQMHTVIIDECTGCDLCVDPCPVDCIDMLPLETKPENWRWQLNTIPVKQIQ